MVSYNHNKTYVLTFYWNLRLTQWQILVNSFTLLFNFKHLKYIQYIFASLKVYWRSESVSCFFISCKSYMSLLSIILTELPNTQLLKNRYYFFSKLVFASTLYLGFKLIYDSTHVLYLNFMALRTCFRTDSCFKACCNNLMSNLSFFLFWKVHVVFFSANNYFFR